MISHSEDSLSPILIMRIIFDDIKFIEFCHVESK